MASLIKPSCQRSWVFDVLNKDFCPSLNAYVYWLKEPIGWFVLATFASMLAGIYVNSIGWTLAASISIVTVVGIAWPWIAIKAVRCEFQPQRSTVYEGERVEAIFRVQNRLPVPIWGLALEGFLDSHVQDDSPLPTISLAWVPPLCTVEYSFELQPEFRGRYPKEMPRIASSFPFGLWTAKKAITSCTSLLVWPHVYPISGTVPSLGKKRGDIGDGQRSGGSSEPIGCRPYRIGDSPRHIHWRLSARNDSLIVIDRSAPEHPEIEVSIDLETPSTIRLQGLFAVRQQIAWKTRITASILTNLSSTRTAFVFNLESDSRKRRPMSVTTSEYLDQLALIPELGSLQDTPSSSNHSIPIQRSVGATTPFPKIEISGHEQDPNSIVVQFHNNAINGRFSKPTCRAEIQCDENLASTLNRLWMELGYVAISA